jgi:phytoene dehydrogenase-like protein
MHLREDYSMHIMIVGAGVAGLTCARGLLRAGHTVTVFEASDAVGGRVRTDNYAGFLLDRGFQVVFDSYPAVQRQLNRAALDLRPFDPGAIICADGFRHVLTDPLRDRDPLALLAAALTPIVGLGDKLRTLALALELRNTPIDDLLGGADRSTLEELQALGFSRSAIDVFFRPFYGGIFLDRSLETSAKCFRFNFKMLSMGHACVPTGGMGQIAQQLAADLVERGAVRLNTPVAALERDGSRVVGVRLADGSPVHADAVVLATPAPEAARLSGLPMPEAHVGTVTLYFSGNAPLYSGRKLLLNAAPDAFVNNAVLLSNVTPTYAPPGRHLLSATVLGLPALNDAELFTRALADLRRMFAGDRAAQQALDGYTPLRLYRIPYAQFAQPPGVHPTLPDNASGIPGLFFAAEFTEASSINAAMISGEKCAALIA